MSGSEKRFRIHPVHNLVWLCVQEIYQTQLVPCFGNGTINISPPVRRLGREIQGKLVSSILPCSTKFPPVLRVCQQWILFIRAGTCLWRCSFYLQFGELLSLNLEHQVSGLFPPSPWYWRCLFLESFLMRNLPPPSSLCFDGMCLLSWAVLWFFSLPLVLRKWKVMCAWFSCFLCWDERLSDVWVDIFDQI